MIRTIQLDSQHAQIEKFAVLKEENDVSRAQSFLKIDVFMLLFWELFDQLRRIQLIKHSKTVVFEGMNSVPCEIRTQSSTKN